MPPYTRASASLFLSLSLSLSLYLSLSRSQRLKVQCHKLVSTFDFSSNVRRYATVTAGTPNLRGTSDLSAELNARYARARGRAVQVDPRSTLC